LQTKEVERMSVLDKKIIIIKISIW
jgi:hypothetical protein